MSLSLVSCQMMRVISSPRSSTTGFSTLIFAMGHASLVGRAPGGAKGIGPSYQSTSGRANTVRDHVRAICQCLDFQVHLTLISGSERTSKSKTTLEPVGCRDPFDS